MPRRRYSKAQIYQKMFRKNRSLIRFINQPIHNKIMANRKIYYKKKHKYKHRI